MRKYLLTGLLLILFHNLFADSWLSPTTITYSSENGKYVLKVIPTFYPEKYWEWQHSNDKKKQKFGVADTVVIPCHAILYQANNKDTTEIWNKALVNPIAPASVLVADNGKSIVTFDDYANLGYGNQVFVVYNENGEMIKKYSLEEFSPFKLDNYMMTVSSIWWRCGEKYLNTELIEICCSTEESEKKIKYNIQTNQFD